MAPSFAVGWRQVGICFMLLAAAGMIASTYSLIAVPLAEEYSPSRMVLMLTMTVMSGTCAVLSPLLGTLMDRFSVKTLMVVGGLFLGAGYAAISLTTSFTQVLVIFGVLIAPANVLIGPVAAVVIGGAGTLAVAVAWSLGFRQLRQIQSLDKDAEESREALGTGRAQPEKSAPGPA